MKTREEIFEEKVRAIPDDELADLCEQYIINIAKDGMKAFRMCIPPMADDTDIACCELIRRFRTLIENTKV